MRKGVLVASALLALAMPAGAQAGGVVTVNGHVGARDGNGSPVALDGASVSLQQPDGTPVGSTTSNGSGDYGFSNVQIASYKVVVSKSGYVTQCRQFFTGIEQPAQAPLVELPTADQAGTINGHITDSFTHQPLQGVTVEVSYDSGCDPPVSTQTGSDGGYVFPSDSLAGPVHMVTYSLAGYNSRTDFYDVFTGPPHDVELDPVDSTDPKTKIKSIVVDGRRATVKFKVTDPPPSSGGLNATCELDGAGPEACESPKRYTHLGKGRHRVKVVGYDAAGNFDETPAKESFRIG